jgi:diaminohydroxyphosphoribosylaminopyrimidine deaminase / 5-amino-6-(5-phosphoribosylamino)uracil reductase
MVTAADEDLMARALGLAERGRGRTSPNPMVGALVVDDDGVIVGRGAHELAGGPHAEVHALADAGARAQGATLYCTLEPCCHTGRTGPCAPRVVGAGIRRAIVAMEDPNPVVGGRGLEHLRGAGIDVAVGVLRDRAEALNRGFLTAMRLRRPFVTLKVALSADARVSGARGVRTALTGAAANRAIHRERAEVDAIAVGSETVLVDDPLLTARGAYRYRPLTRVIFDRRVRVAPSARVFATIKHGPIVIATAADAGEDAQRRADALSGAGAVLLPVPANGGPFVSAVLEQLARMEIRSVVVEGGPRLHGAFWDAGVVDRVQMYVASKRLGASGVPWLSPPACALANLTDVEVTTHGDDTAFEGYVHRTD